MSREITIVTPEHVELKFELAGLGSRFIALLLDSLWQSLGFFVIGIIAFFSLFGAPGMHLESTSPWIIAILILLVFAIWSGYFLFFEATRNGQTPGKKAAGIRVIRDTGHPIDFRAALLRNLMRIVDQLPAAYGVGVISVFVSPQYRRLGDYVAGTLVVKIGTQNLTSPERKSAVEAHAGTNGGYQPIEQSPFMLGTSTTSADDQRVERFSDGVSTGASDQFVEADPVLSQIIPHLHTLTRDDYRVVRHFLDRRRELGEQQVWALAGKLSDPIARKMGLAPEQIANPVSFLEIVAGEWERRRVH